MASFYRIGYIRQVSDNRLDSDPFQSLMTLENFNLGNVTFNDCRKSISYILAAWKSEWFAEISLDLLDRQSAIVCVSGTPGTNLAITHDVPLLLPLKPD